MHGRALLGEEPHQAPALELEEGLPGRRPGDAGLRGELDLGEHLPRGDLTADDAPGDVVGQAAGSRGTTAP